MSRATLSKRTLSAIGSILVVVVIALITAWTQSGGSDHPSAVDSGRTPSAAAASSTGRPATDPELPPISVAELPSQARRELDLIDAGGPFRYPGKDGSTFLNNEGILPDQPRGYYREYTVDTPGSEDRGARRIITGKNGEFYYTDDHYESFSQIER